MNLKSPNPYQLKLAVFEGPFDLLLYLIKKNQIDIYDIPIAVITEEYHQYLDMMRKLNLNVASEFIVIAANLIYIKAKMLLPKDEEIEGDEEDPRMELVQHLIEYNTFKELSEKMRLYEAKKRELFERLRPVNVSKEEKELSLDIYVLVKAMDSVLERMKERRMVVIPGETVKVRDRMTEIVETLKKEKSASFFDMINREGNNKAYIIAFFMAILELVRLRVISVYQDRSFEDIRIYMTAEKFDESILNRAEG
ncbi:MAG: segregation and condensation protein A [Candidatus Goldiibacteriota bacterium]